MATTQQTVNFFASEDVARRRTWELAILFTIAIVIEVFGFSFVTAIAYMVYTGFDPDFPTLVRQCMLYVSPVTLLILGIGFFYSVNSMKNGGEAIAKMIDGKPLPKVTTSVQDKKLRDVVEEIALAAGVDIPQIYVLRDESAINSFAAGQPGKDAIIGVTQGALDKLSRDELQAVIAHEFSHILNRDTVLNIRTLSVVTSLASISFIGYVLFAITTQSKWDLRLFGLFIALFLAGVLLIGLGLLGELLGRLVRAAVTRQREKLADASAVQFTRNPEAVASALYRVSRVGSKLTHRRTEELNNFLFADGVDSSWAKVRFLATHPPIKDRIRAVDPTFLQHIPQGDQRAGDDQKAKHGKHH